MDAFDLDAWLSRSQALDLADLDWRAAARHPLAPEAVRTLAYMQDVESHTIVYLRQLLATRAIDDPEIAAFPACWIYEESAHGRALARFLAAAGHPLLTELLARIVRDESRHFFFYFKQAERQLARPGAARVARFVVDRFWAPVGSGVQPAAETRFVASYLVSGAWGRAAARRVDETIRRLPGFEGVELLEAWAAGHG